MVAFVIDTSALVAIYRKEPMASALVRRLGKATTAIVPATCLVEIALLRRMEERLLGWVQDLVGEPPYQLVGLSLAESQIAAVAARRYGKGSGHPAQLNFGDCLVYAAASYRNLPLLFTGSDFGRTDIPAALNLES